jgi:hypothetical protein
MKIKVYVLFNSTDNCTYHDTIYCDTFSTKNQATAYIDHQCRPVKGFAAENRKDYEIKVEVLENPEFFD